MRFPLLLAGLILSFTLSAADKKPNILMIAIDDQNDWIGYLGGHPMVKTPHIDRLAKRGTAFTNAHCQSPLCNPSRTSLMTSLRPGTTGIYGLAPWIRNVPEFKDTVTLPQYLKKHGGYTMWMAGGGVKGGMRYGQTDEYGFAAVDGRMHIHDWHATVLHLLGLNHKKLTFNYSGRDFRLTDVHGNVAKEILA